MSAITNRKKFGSLLQAILRWFRTRPDRGARDLADLSDREVEHIATDIGVSTTDLYRLARSDSRGAELLARRMAALDLDCQEVARLMPETLHDLQRLCTFCSRRKSCARDLGRDPFDPKWKDYCPNVATVLALDAMPWAARNEW